MSCHATLYYNWAATRSIFMCGLAFASFRLRKRQSQVFDRILTFIGLVLLRGHGLAIRGAMA